MKLINRQLSLTIEPIIKQKRATKRKGWQIGKEKGKKM